MIAVLSDIHGNLPALEAVIADARAAGATAFVNLGDSLSGPLWPAETADLLMREGWPTIAGNHERQLLTHSLERMNASDRFARERLSSAQLAWLAAQPQTLGCIDIQDWGELVPPPEGEGDQRSWWRGSLHERADQLGAAYPSTTASRRSPSPSGGGMFECRSALTVIPAPVPGSTVRQAVDQGFSRIADGGVDPGTKAGMTEVEGILCVHGSPRSDLEHLLHTVEPAGTREATEAEIADRLGDTAASLVLCGHTHLPRVATLADGRTVANPGSVGLQAFHDDHPLPYIVENGDPLARYALVRGIEVELRAVAYDHASAAAKAAREGRDDWAIALRTGFAD